MLLTNNLQCHNLALKNEIMASIERVVESGWYILGNEVKNFEKEFAKWCGVKECISLASGTDALELALRAVGIGPGDKVITVANGGGYATTALLAIGAKPVYADVDTETSLLSEDAVAALLSPEIRGVIVTHLYGRCAPVSRFLELLQEYNIPLIEDCAQAHGAKQPGEERQIAGSLGDVGCFSFYPTKNMGALGDGGAVVTNRAEVAATLRSLRQYGWQEKYSINLSGGRNSRLDEIQAAILRLKLQKIDQWNENRRKIAARYIAEISNPALILPPFTPNTIFHLFVLQVTENRAELQKYMREKMIFTEPHYPVADHNQPLLAERYLTTSLPVTEQLCNTVLSIPCFPEMSEEEVTHVIATLNSWSPV